MSAVQVASLRVTSEGGERTAEITVIDTWRGDVYASADPRDLPDDLRAALLFWLGVTS